MYMCIIIAEAIVTIIPTRQINAYVFKSILSAVTIATQYLFILLQLLTKTSVHT